MGNIFTTHATAQVSFPLEFSLTDSSFTMLGSLSSLLSEIVHVLSNPVRLFWHILQSIMGLWLPKCFYLNVTLCIYWGSFSFFLQSYMSFDKCTGSCIHIITVAYRTLSLIYKNSKFSWLCTLFPNAWISCAHRFVCYPYGLAFCSVSHTCHHTAFSDWLIPIYC